MRNLREYWSTAVALLLAVNAVSSQQYTRTIYVDPERGSNTETCVNESSIEQPCKNLSYVFQPQYRESSTRYSLQPGTHYLNSTASDHLFTGLTDIAITGNASSNSPVTIVCFTENSGLSFYQLKNIILGNLNVTNCSSRQNGTSRNVTNSAEFDLLPVQTALYFSNCTNISMEGVVVTNSPNGSAVTVYNTVGTNTFTGCEFSQNSGPVNSSLSGGGGGVYVEFSYCIPGNTNCQTSTDPSYVTSNSGSLYNFTDCNFTNNSATTTGSDNMIPQKENHTAFGLGGGLSVFFCGNASKNVFLISSCNFSRNNAKYGGGLFIEFADVSTNNSVMVVDTYSLSNCEPPTGVVGSVTNPPFGGVEKRCVRGGGVYTSHMIFPSKQEVKYYGENRVNFTNCNISENNATTGGGVRVVATPQNNTSFNFSLTGVTFWGNRATGGGAALMVQATRSSLREQLPFLFIHNCTFNHNSVHPDYHGPQEVGLGIIYVEGADVKFSGENIFYHNFGSALALVEASATTANTMMYFFNNSAVNGGGLTLLDSARVIINQRTSMIFELNYAYSIGGAIFNKNSDSNAYRYISNCFIVHEDSTLDPDMWGAQFIFRNNYDSRGKNAIYSPSLLPCTSLLHKNLSRVFCWKNWTYQYNDQVSHNCSEYIHTAPGNIVINTNTSNDDVVVFAHRVSISGYPGEVKDIPISVFDDLNHTTKAVFLASKSSRSSLDPDYSYVSDNKVRVLGKPNSSVQIDLNSIGDRNWHVRFFVNLTECPPGLLLLPTTIEINNGSNSSLELTGDDEWGKLEEGDLEEEDWFEVLNESSSACMCYAPTGIAQILRCNNDTDAALLSGHWMGKDRIGRWHGYVVSPCPSGFCRTGTYAYISLPKLPKELEEHICGVHHRRGRVCGQCVEGYGPVVSSGSFECVPYNSSGHTLSFHIFYYVLSVYVPLFLLFLVIIVFNIKLTTGPANAFILFSQVISSTLNINADNRIPLNSISPNINGLLKAYQFPYGIFNLQFFELFVPKKHLCFGTHLNALDLLLLQYLVAFSPLLMILAIVGFYRIIGRCNWCSVCLCKLCGNRRICKNSSDRLRKSTVPAIASFILLSYTKFSLTSSQIVTPTRLATISGKYGTIVYFYYAGHEAFSNTENIFHYILPATLVFMTFVVIPPLLLLDYPLRLLERTLRLCPLLWRLYPSGKIHILLDAFQGCYKDRYRWFAGLYFLFRLLINLANALTEDLKQFFIQGLFCSVFALLVLICKPYKRQFYLLNYFDGFIFVNLTVINQITLYLYADTRRGAHPSVLLFSVQYILVMLPLVYMVVYVMWRVLPIPRVRTRVREWLETQRHNHQMENLIQNDEKAETPDDVDWERARAINCYKPVRSPEGPLHSSISRPTSHTLTHSTTHHQPSEGERGSGKDYGSTGRSDSGIAATGGYGSFSSNDSASEQK